MYAFIIGAIIFTLVFIAHNSNKKELLELEKVVLENNVENKNELLDKINNEKKIFSNYSKVFIVYCIFLIIMIFVTSLVKTF